MGAWDLGPFDNDAALDFVGDLEEVRPEELPERLRPFKEALAEPQA